LFEIGNIALNIKLSTLIFANFSESDILATNLVGKAGLALAVCAVNVDLVTLKPGSNKVISISAN